MKATTTTNTATIDVLNSINDEYPNLSIGEINTNNTSYPCSAIVNGCADRAVTGFETLEQAQECAEKFDGIVTLFRTTNGDKFYYDYGRMNRYLTVEDYVKDMGDNCSIIIKDEFFDPENISDMIKGKNSPEEVGEFLNDLSNLYQEFDNLDDEHLMVCYGGLSTCEPIANEMMSYRYDNKQYIIGVTIQNQDEQ